jgi:hypothetical protein
MSTSPESGERLVRFDVADSLTRQVVARLEPSRWELSDPLGSPGTGSLTIARPEDSAKVAQLVEMTQPHNRWIAVEDDAERILWCGPVLATPGFSGGEITVSVADWRTWFYLAPIRPLSNGTRRNYIQTGAAAREQCLIMTDLATLALDTVGAPHFVVDTAPDSDTTREITAMMLDRPIGEHLASIQDRDRGCEWYCYATWSAADTLLPHFAVAWPERGQRTFPIRVEYVAGEGGNVHDYAWPEGRETFSRVWAVGDGEPPAQVFTSDQDPGIADDTELAWETVLGPLDGVVKTATAFEYAYAEVQRTRRLADGQAEFSIADERIPLGDVMTGDRARVILENGWVSVDVDAARIVSRTISGGRDQPLMQRITVDLADDVYPDDGSVPGTAVGE